jgi:F-type H+-transporting ATPase subunit epsilon
MAEATNQLRVRLVTPDRVLTEKAVDAVTLPSKSGYLEVLYGHAPLLAELGAGNVVLHGGQENDETYNVSWGFVEVVGDRVTILADSASKPEEIDTARAEKLLEKGHQLWNQAGEDAYKYEEANRMIAEAESKLASAGKH